MTTRREGWPSALRWTGWACLAGAAIVAVILVRGVSQDGGPSLSLTRGSAVVVALALGGLAMLACRFSAGWLASRRQTDTLAHEWAESEARTRVIVDTAADGIITIDEGGIIRSFNAAAERIFGYSTEEVLGKSVNMLMPSPHREEHDGYILHHIQTGESKGIGKGREREGIRKDGTIIPIEAAVSEVPLRDRHLFTGIIRDISERKRAEEALHKSRSFLQTIIDEIPESLMVIDRNYRVILANRTVREMVDGKDPVSSLLACYEVSHHRNGPCDDDAHPCPLEQVVSTKAPMSVTHTHVDVNGNESLMEIIAAPVFDEAGEVVQIIESSRDVTVRMRAEELARRRQAEMAHMARLGTMGEMAAGMAHELNQPLSAIVNYTQACLERLRTGAEDRDELLEDLERAAAQAERAGDVVEHVRAFVRKGKSQRSKTDLNSLVRGAVELLGAELRQSGIQPKLALAEPLPNVEVVPIQIEQVLVNLIQNGLDAMADVHSDGRDLQIQSLRGEDGWVQLDVRDAGCGLPTGSVEQLFDPFFTTKPEGMGMGLSISRSIIEAHGGRLWAIPEPEQGATLRFTLPIASGGGANEP